MIFTLALWVLAVFLFYSGFGNKTNRWVAYCLLIASIGTLKEYLNEKLVPILIKLYPSICSELYVTIDSCLIAVLYLLLPLCFITMSMYFAGYDNSDKKVILLVQFCTVILISILLLVYYPIYFKHYQLHRRDFWYVMSAYNIGYSIAGFIIIHRGIKNESDEKIRRNKRVITKVFSVWVIRGAAILAIIFSLIGKISIVIQTIPSAVMGGMTLYLYGVIIISGIRMLVEQQVDYAKNYNLALGAITFLVGTCGATVTIGAVSVSGMVLAAVVGMILSLIIYAFSKIGILNEEYKIKFRDEIDQSHKEEA